jgi:hypothetical protein
MPATIPCSSHAKKRNRIATRTLGGRSDASILVGLWDRKTGPTGKDEEGVMLNTVQCH